jgi:hypothetical protein
MEKGIILADLEAGGEYEQISVIHGQMLIILMMTS